MKSMLVHSFVLDALATTGADTFSHFEELINEHRDMCIVANASSSSNSTTMADNQPRQSRLKRLVPTVGVFHTPLPLRRAYEAYNAKYKLDRRRHLAISFNEIRHILNLAQIMAFCSYECSDNDDNDNDGQRYSSGTVSNGVRLHHTNPLDSPTFMPIKGNPNEIPGLSLLDADGGGSGSSDKTTTATTITTTTNDNNHPTAEQQQQQQQGFNGPSMITFDGDQTLYSDGANFESNPRLATYLYLLLRNGVTVAVVTAAGYEYQTEKYELRLSGLLQFFRRKRPLLTEEQLNRFYLFGGECNYLLRLGNDYGLHPVREHGAGGWMTATKYLGLDSPANWPEPDVARLLDLAEASLKASIRDQNLRARFIRKKRSVGLVPEGGGSPPIPREALDETVLRAQGHLDENIRSLTSNSNSNSNNRALDAAIPYCAFNGGRDVWVDVGNKRVGVQILQSYLGVPAAETLHIGDQFLNTGNDYAARKTCPCIWITNPDETTYVLKSILRLAGIVVATEVTTAEHESEHETNASTNAIATTGKGSTVDFAELDRRTNAVATMDVYTGELLATPAVPPPNHHAAAAANATTSDAN